MSLTITKDIILKYDIPGPRYTSYPTAPNWDQNVTGDVYIQKLKQFGKSNKTLSVYIHIPFCRTLCSFCACNVIIRKADEKYGDEYLGYLFKEIDLVRKNIGKKALVKQLHWGGGTPTFLNERQIKELFHKLEESFEIDKSGEVAIEIDPRTIDKKKVETLRKLGFNRVSMGIQDFDEDVQKNINRFQPLKIVQDFNGWCRELKFDSVNFDLVYGLPEQSVESFSQTIDEVIKMRPDRIALYSFAYVPWLKHHQKKIDQTKMPSNDAKLEIFLNSRKKFLNSGYQAIAMDHFALDEDELAKSFKNGALYRNFMGYTVKPADEYIGLGLTSIGFIEKTFIQNHKVLADYFKDITDGKLPVERGKELNTDDQIRQWTINSLMCQFELDQIKFFETFKFNFEEYFKDELPHLQKCINEGLLKLQNNKIFVTELGRIFIRNVCMGFDAYLKKTSTPQRFSRTI